MSYYEIPTKERITARIFDVTKRCPHRGKEVTIIGVDDSDPKIGRGTFVQCLLKTGQKIKLRICAFLDCSEILERLKSIINNLYKAPTAVPA